MSITDPTDPAAWYDARAAALADCYEAVAPERLHGWLDRLLPATWSLVLDVGSGSVEQAAGLDGLAHDVVAVRPSAALRAEAFRRHPEAGVRWVADQLSALPITSRFAQKNAGHGEAPHATGAIIATTCGDDTGQAGTADAAHPPQPHRRRRGQCGPLPGDDAPRPCRRDRLRRPA